jgi:3-hexulose-6-phosphate synthase
MTEKKLQLAIDVLSTKDALEIVSEAGQYADIIEVGTPLCIAEGAHAVKAIKEACPDKKVFADIKVMDGGDYVPRSVIDAGCDMFSVLAATDDNTMRESIKLAHDHGVMVLADFCNVPDMSKRGSEIDAMGADYLCCHVGYGRQEDGADPVEELRALAPFKTPKAIAGGIKLDTVEAALNSAAQVIIVGAGICAQDDRAAMARKIRLLVDAYNQSH